MLEYLRSFQMPRTFRLGFQLSSARESTAKREQALRLPIANRVLLFVNMVVGILR